MPHESETQQVFQIQGAKQEAAYFDFSDIISAELLLVVVLAYTFSGSS